MIIYATIALIWVLSIGVSITMMYLVKKISHIEQDTVTREEFDVEHRRAVTEVVHCKDCKNAIANVDEFNVICNKQDWATTWNIDDYCSYGERKDG